MFILRFDVESAYALNPSIESDENWQIWLEETLASVEQITRVLKRYDAPATFCIVGKVLERAGERCLLSRLLADYKGKTTIRCTGTQSRTGNEMGMLK